MSVINDFVSGMAGGAAGMLVEYPFDTVKVLLQVYGLTRYHGYWDCICQTFRQDGVLGFYRGLVARLIASGFEHACVFVFYKWTLRLIGANVEHPTLSQICVGGCGSGVASMLCLTPFELIKCNMQADDGTLTSKRQFRSSWHCFRHIYKQNGIRGLYRGGVATLLREVPGTAAWCGTYDTLKSYMTPAGHSVSELPLYKLMFAGGCSGVAFWTVFFPADVVKTRMQVDAHYGKTNFAHALAMQYREGGLESLYRGWTLTALRSFPSNAIIFMVFDLCSRHITNWQRAAMLASASHTSSTITTPSQTATSPHLSSSSSTLLSIATRWWPSWWSTTLPNYFISEEFPSDLNSSGMALRTAEVPSSHLRVGIT